MGGFRRLHKIRFCRNPSGIDSRLYESRASSGRVPGSPRRVSIRGCAGTPTSLSRLASKSSPRRWHLEDAGVDLGLWDVPSNSSVRSSIDNRKEPVKICQVDLWLPEFPRRNDGRVERIETEVLYRDHSTRPDPQFNRPLLGVRCFMSARTKVEIDFAAKTTSLLWPPG